MIQETDIYGESKLKSISGADKFNRWMYVQMKPFMQGKILEIGSCIGNLLGTFDFIGKFGLFVVGKMFSKKIIPESNMMIYNLFVPIFKVIDKILLNQLGLSVIQV